MKRIAHLRIDGNELLAFGTIKGLVSERDKVRELIKSFNPDMVLVGVSPEQWVGLENYVKKPFKIEPDDYEVIYAMKLERFGEVGLPVPTYLEILKLSQNYGFQIIPVDMDDETYSELFTRKIDIIKLIHFDMRKRKLYKMVFDVSTPEEFVIKWDREVNKIKEYQEIEEERERFMSNEIIRIAQGVNGKRIMIVVELERYQGILKNLSVQV